ncbi:MAG TPA: O-methyltransferase [Acidobacteriaceae bacterium]|nr:O-methyltransferase [Acidobacteriaceae bacterium]
MSKKKWTAVDRYITDTLIPADPVLDAALAASNDAGLPAIAVAPNQGRFLMILAQAIGARSILEMGSLGGYSTIWLARALPADGKLITLEADAKHAEVARANIARAGFADKVELRLGKALDTLPAIAAEGLGPFDLIFIDADKGNYPGYLEWALRLSRPGTLIIGDNVVRDGKVIDAADTDPSVQGVRRMNEIIAGEQRLTATAIQTVGSKGYDGFMIAIVKNPEHGRT